MLSMASELQRFIITKPVEGGTQWFDVRDTQDETMQNRPLASFAADLPIAEQMADEVCDWLNNQRGRRCDGK